jgi:hypothetical protein
MKCSHQDCARDARKNYHGTHVQGPKTTGFGVPYCLAHYEQVRKGRTPGPIRKKGISPYQRAVIDCADIASFHGHHDLAILLRKLNKTL